MTFTAPIPVSGQDPWYDDIVAVFNEIRDRIDGADNIRYVSNYIPPGTDTTGVNCSAYVQSAITDAGIGGTIIINGRLRCDTELQLLNFQIVQGTGVFMGTGGGITTNCLDFRNVTANAAKSDQKVGIRLAAGNIIRDILIDGPGPTVANSRGISSEDAVATSPRLYNVQVFNFERGVHLFGAYYTRMYDCDFVYNGTGLYADACYNLNLYGAKFTCRASDLSSFGTGIYINGLARGLTMHGGSIEDYSTGIRVANNSTVTLSGVYFESPNYVHAVGLDATALSGIMLDLSGCSVYLVNHDFWVKMGTGNSVVLRGSGNKFIYSQYDSVAPVDTTPAPTTPVAYNIGLSVGDVRLDGDSWKDVYYQFPNQQVAYTDNSWTNGGVANYTVQFPLGDQVNRHLNHYIGRNLILPSGKTVTAAAYNALGLTGAVAATRYVGGTTSGAPTTGDFAVGDFIISQNGIVWVCTTAGTPGTWKSRSGSDLWLNDIVASDPQFGTPGTRSAFIAALDAAEAKGKGTIVRIPAGLTVDVGNGLSLSGYSVQIKGDGASTSSSTPNCSTIVASTQTGPVLDFTGYVTSYSFKGRMEPLSGVYIKGSGVADATKVNSGIKIKAMSSAWFHDISISDTGGPNLELAQNLGNACYLNDFDRITLLGPVSAGTNDVAWFYADECNGNRFRGIGLRATTNPGAVGVSGAVVVVSNSTYRTEYALFDGWWFENLWIPNGGTLFSLQANGCAIRDTQFFDCLKENGSYTGTSYYKLLAPPTQDWGGNIITGLIPGHESSTAVTIDTGVDIRQSRTTVIGPKGFQGNNVTLASGVDHCTVWLTAGFSGSTVLGWTDNSGASNNRLVDDYNHTEVRPNGWKLSGITTTSGTGSPESVVVGNVGDCYIRTDGGPGFTEYSKGGFAGLNLGWHPLETEYLTTGTLAGVSQAIPFSTAPSWVFILTANQTFSSISGSRTGGRLTVMIKQDATGSRLVTWPAAIKWAGGSAPTLSTAANAVDVFVFMYDGSLWREVSRVIGT